MAAVMIAIHASLLAWGAVSNSVTFDEFVHLPSGIVNWKSGDFSICCVSPPLVRLWAALPALMMNVEVPPPEITRAYHADSKHWVYARAFQNANRARYHEIFVAARFAMIPISCIGAWLVWRWASQLHGFAAGFAGCSLYCLCPNILAHGSLVTTDVTTAVCMVGALYAWQHYVRQPNRKRLLWAVASISIAHLCKFTAMLLWPIMVVSAALMVWRGTADQRRAIPRGLVLSAIVTLMAINVTYGFKGTGSSLGTYTLESRTCATLSRLPEWLPVPLPRDFVIGFDAQKREAEGDYMGLLMDEIYVGWKWLYYPVALAVKLPLTTLALLFVAIGVGLRRMRRNAGNDGAEWFVVLCIAAIMIGMILLTQINIGLRYLLPLLPLLYLFVSSLWKHRARWWKPALTGALALLAIESLRVSPRFLTFFNATVGGPQRGYRVLNDSNFDWGQGLLDLKGWMAREGVNDLSLCYFGSVDPGVYGIQYSPITDGVLKPYVAVSSFYLAGLPHHMPLPDGRTQNIQLGFFRELQARAPVAVPGNTIYIFTRDDVAASSSEFAMKQRAGGSTATVP